MGNLFKSKLLTQECKMHMYRTIIRPVLTYGAETWALTQSEEEELLRHERRIVRRIYGATRDNQGNFRQRRNEELEQIIGGRNVVRFIKAQRIRWAGHMARMGMDRVQRRIFEEQPMRGRPRGRPRRRWGDGVQRDLRTMGVGDCWRIAEDRGNWRRIVSEAKAHPEL